MISWINNLIWYPQEEDKTCAKGDLKGDVKGDLKGDLKGGVKIKVKPVIKIIIKPEDLKSIVLKKHTLPIQEKKIKRPALARNSPGNSFSLLRLSNKHLEEILKVKLKPVKIEKRKNKWDSRHPVLRELQRTVDVVH